MVEGFITVDLDSLRFKAAFIAGLFHGVTLFNYYTDHKYFTLHDTHLESLTGTQIAIGGFLVGLGTRLGNGCTSGHGVVGLSKRSPRSIVSVVVFLTTAMFVATIWGNIFGHHSHLTNRNIVTDEHVAKASTAFGAGLLLYALYDTPYLWPDSIISYLSGALFSIGLAVSGMSSPSKVVNFLKVTEMWDPSLLFVLGASVGINLIVFHFAHEKLEKPILCTMFPKVEQGLTRDKRECGTFSSPSTVLDVNLVLGAWLFGIGWAVTGICPGPGILLVASGQSLALQFYLPGLVFGMLAAVEIKKREITLIKPVVHRHSENVKAAAN